MQGQLWEPCPRCEAEPVCSECEYCTDHCTCAATAQDAAQVRAFEQAYPGLLSSIERHHAQGTQEQ